MKYYVRRLDNEPESGWYLFHEGKIVQAAAFDNGIDNLSDALDAAREVVLSIRSLEESFNLGS